MTNKRKTFHLLLLAVFAEIIMFTENLAITIVSLFSSNPFMQSITGNLLTCLFWLGGIALICMLYNKDKAIHYKNIKKPTKKQFLIGGMLLLTTLIISLISWGGFKPVKEIMFGIENIGIWFGITRFAIQYIYYFFEVILMIIIISLSQEAWDVNYPRKNIPFGGLVLAVLWGLIHIAFHGVLDGAITTICALLYGCAFLAMQKNVKYAFPLIFFMFIL